VLRKTSAMDLTLYARVLWRFRFLVVLGVLAASMLALVSAVEVDVVDGSPRFSYRAAEQWQSQATLLVTEPGFPEGYKAPFVDGDEVSGSAARGTPRFADPGRFASLAVLYANLVGTGPVRGLLQSRGPVDGTIEASARSSPSEGALPFVDVAAVSATPAASMRLAQRGAEALRDYIAREQAANGVPEEDRVVLTMLGEPGKAQLLAGRPKAVPIVAFLAALLAVLATAFALENLRSQGAPRPDVHPSPS
jgi:hypothetical protein